MERVKGATATDQAAHRLFDNVSTCNTGGRNNGCRCKGCGYRLKTSYHEERLYSVHCPVCCTVVLVKAGSPGEAESRVGRRTYPIHERS